MRSSLRDVTRKAYEAYIVSERVPWIVTWPGQVVLCISSMYWTTEMFANIRTASLMAYERKCTSQLQDIVNKVSSVSPNFAKQMSEFTWKCVSCLKSRVVSAIGFTIWFEVAEYFL